MLQYFQSTDLHVRVEVGLAPGLAGVVHREDVRLGSWYPQMRAHTMDQPVM